MKIFILVLFSVLNSLFYSQVFLNGNFENNFATGDIINMSNKECNAKLKDISSFGTYGDVDIISSSAYGGSGAQNGHWYIGITGGGTDIVALTLSAPLVEGKIYSVSFYDRKTSGYPVFPIQIGLSKTNTGFGTIIHTVKEAAVLDKWTQRTFTFTAPHDGKYITVQMESGGIQDWVNLDNFVFNNTTCDGALKIVASALTIEQSSSATFSVSGGTEYAWDNSTTLNTSYGNIVIANPRESTIYTVTSKQKNCPALTATVALNVIKPIEKIQKDTFVQDKIVHIIPAKKHKKLFNTHRVNGRKFIVQESLTVSNGAIKIMVWDKNRADGDEVALYLNGELVIEKFTVTKTKKEILLDLQPGKNIIVMHALNFGSIPPNTAALSVVDGNSKAKLITLVSTFKKSGALEVFYDPLVYNK